MAGIGFELRKLFREKGLLNNVKAYAFSSLTTIGPMVLSMLLIVLLQWMMSYYDASFLEKELYISTVQYGFIFSILLTGGFGMLLTRFIADMIFLKKYEHLLSSYYGVLAVCLPFGMVIAYFFLRGVDAGIAYKIATYLFFIELIIIWFQSVYLSALKDYLRVVRNFGMGVCVSLLVAWLLLGYTEIPSVIASIAAIDCGFFVVLLLSSYHFEQAFPPAQSKLYFSFLAYFGKYPSLFLIGFFFYSGVYIHSFVYWLGPEGIWVADRFAVSPVFDLPVFYAFITVIPTLVTFVVSVETAFYEKFRSYYMYILEHGTFQEIHRAKQNMQRVLRQEISFLMEVQLLFTIVSLAVGMKLLPVIGFTMSQLDMFNILVLGYFLFIMTFVLLLVLLYFDDRKGVLLISGTFVLLNAVLTYWSMLHQYDGLGMFLAALVSLGLALGRLMYYVRNIDYYTFCAQPIAVRPGRRSSVWRKLLGKPIGAVLLFAAVAMLLAACEPQSNAKDSPTVGTDSETVAAGAAQAGQAGLTEDKRIYEQDVDDEVKTLYVTVLPDQSNSGPPLSWYAMNRLTDRYNEDTLKVIAQEGAADGSGPKQGMFGYGTTAANAKISVRGNTARYAAQKSYKIRLNDEAGLWNGQRVLDLNKHSFDMSHMRNKLSFDLMETLPNMTSLRTQFVHLYVKDMSEGGKGLQYADYGLYTQIEQPNKMFLKSHWLDPYGQLYKASFFEFFRYPDQLKSQSDPAYDKKAFETILEIKGREDHDKLLAMLDDVNNTELSIDKVFEKHFDLDNYLTWMAMNILMDNMDTTSSNFLLYSPLNSDKWYFLPWDYDGGWRWEDDVERAKKYGRGLSNYWGSVLHNRYFRSAEHVRQLQDKIKELSNLISEERITRQLNLYQHAVKPFLLRSPDIDYLPKNVRELDTELRRIAETPKVSKEWFLQDIEKPKPFFQDDVRMENGKQVFAWNNSYDLQGDDLTYDWSLALDPSFQRIVGSKRGLTQTRLEIDKLKPDIYYWKVKVRDEHGHEQISFDEYEDEEGNSYYGIREFEVR